MILITWTYFNQASNWDMVQRLCWFLGGRPILQSRWEEVGPPGSFDSSSVSLIVMLLGPFYRHCFSVAIGSQHEFVEKKSCQANLVSFYDRKVLESVERSCSGNKMQQFHC